jgi:hypothetical protein
MRKPPARCSHACSHVVSNAVPRSQRRGRDGCPDGRTPAFGGLSHAPQGDRLSRSKRTHKAKNLVCLESAIRLCRGKSRDATTPVVCVESHGEPRVSGTGKPVKCRGLCAQGDSNSHGPNGPQGPQPCAPPARRFLPPPYRTFRPGHWTIWIWWTARLLSRCCHAAAQRWLRSERAHPATRSASSPSRAQPRVPCARGARSSPGTPSCARARSCR